MNKSHVTIYCDGSCLGNPGPGGYAALLLHQKDRLSERIVFGSQADSTNNRMELIAAIEGLKALTRPCKVDLYTDSQYLVKGMKEWLYSWQKNGFKSANNKAIANQDLWQSLLILASKHEISWHWVRGHAGNEYNERVDEIAREQAMAGLYSKP